MVASRAVLAMIIGGVIAACGAGVASSPPEVAPRSDAPDVAATASAASPSVATVESPNPSWSPQPAPEVTPVLEPPKPSGVKFDEQVRVSGDERFAVFTQSVSWRTPRTEGIEIRVYGVTKCLAEPEEPPPDSNGPCLVVHTALPTAVRTILATASASDGVASWTWTEEAGCDIGTAFDPDGRAYYAVVLAAYTASAHSVFTIAEPGGWWRPGLTDIVC